VNDDLDRLLRESLGAVKKTYERERAPEPQRAESRLLQRLRRKRGWFGAGAALAAGVIALLVAFLAFSLPGLIRSHNSPQVAADNDPAIKLSVATDPQPVTVGIRYGKQWVGTSLGVQIFSERDARFVHRVNLGAPPSDLRLGDTQAWVTLPALGEVASINERTYAIHRYHVVQGRAATMSLSVGDTAVWIVVNGERIVRLDLTTAKLLDVPVSQPLDISARRSSEVWAFTKSGLQRLDTNSGQPVGPLIPNPTSTGDIFIRDDAIYLARSKEPRASSGGGSPCAAPMWTWPSPAGPSGYCHV
jgi:hypothetical protein